MQQNASDLDLDREKRMAAIAENEAAEREADEAARARSAKTRIPTADQYTSHRHLPEKYRAVAEQLQVLHFAIIVI
ncbi:MAG: hypothetical protein Q9193_004909 [Seirophora villosa]